MPAETIFAAELERVPTRFRNLVQGYWERYCLAAQEQKVPVLDSSNVLEVLLQVWTYSDFVARLCIRFPALPHDLLQSGDLLVDYASEEYVVKLRRLLTGCPDVPELRKRLRRFRQREMMRIAWRDLAGWASLDETLRELSALADACLAESLVLLQRWFISHWGQPVDSNSKPQQLIVLGMGKLGAQELNFSSDVDLICAFREAGTTRGGREIPNEEFFNRLARDFVNLINDVTEDGFVFRVDVRLRPFGESGPLTMSFDALEDYYQSQAREWERYAMVKGRPVAGDLAAGEQLLKMLRPFIYRRYLDYGAFESLREMKTLITQELERKGMGDNIKLGLGGIREIEFIGQAFQLIRGGREPELQERSILAVLRYLGQRGHLPPHVATELQEAYLFLRRVENRLQAYRDHQTHVLPTDGTARLRLALSMGFTTWEELQAALQRYRSRVQEHFEQVFAAPEIESNEQDKNLAAIWQGRASRKQALEILSRVGYQMAESAFDGLMKLHESSARRAMSSEAQARLDRLMPLLVAAAASSHAPEQALQRLLGLIEAVLRRSSYLALLADNPLVLSQLVRLAAASPWIVRLLTRYPLLLDELLDPRTLYAPPERGHLEAELDILIRRFSADDLEQQMESLRQFVHGNSLRVAAAEITDAMPLMRVSDNLTEIAEVVLEKTLRLAWQHLIQRHGVPYCRDEDGHRPAGFAIIAYGKLGGIELSYGSDLDLVFLHDSAGEDQYTDGSKPVDNAVFFARLGQRIIHMLNTPTSSGIAYQIDTRLRPNGNAGLLVTSLPNFERYQQHEAWTWEHQALVRARVVAGDNNIRMRFPEIRAAVLARQRAAARLCQDVVDMRERMRSELGSRDSSVFDLKQDAGGIADIEFMVQYGALRWAWRYPSLIRYTDSIRILEALAATGLMAAADVTLLADAYREFRGAVHRNTLQDKPAEVPASEFVELREGVKRIWSTWMKPNNVQRFDDELRGAILSSERGSHT